MTRPGRTVCLFILLAAFGHVDAARVTINEDSVLVPPYNAHRRT